MGKSLKKFTLDTNCMLAVDDERETAIHIKKVLQAHKLGLIELAIVAAAASERQQGNIYLEQYEMFEERRRTLGFGDAEVLQVIGRHDVSYWGHCLGSTDEWESRENQIYKVLFPNSEIELKDFVSARGLDPDETTSEEYQKAYGRWRNNILDAQAYWAHDHNDRDVFVTHDKAYKKLNGHPAFPRGHVVNHEEVGAMMEQLLAKA